MDNAQKEHLATEFAGVLEAVREHKWAAFSEAATQSQLNPYAALSRLLVRIVEGMLDQESDAEDDQIEDDQITEEKLDSFLLASFIAFAVDELHGDKKLRLAHLVEQAGSEDSWQELIRHKYQIDQEFISRIFKVLRQRYQKQGALIFINRGLHNPRPVESLMEVLGEDFFNSD